MRYQVRIRLTGERITAFRTRPRFILERTAEAKTLGDAMDSLVELAYVIHEQVTAWLEKNPYGADRWHISCDWPDLRDPKPSPKHNVGSGGAITPGGEIVLRALNIRDMEIHRALQSRKLKRDPGIFEEVRADREIDDLRTSKTPLSKWRNYGFQGRDLDSSR